MRESEDWKKNEEIYDLLSEHYGKTSECFLTYKKPHELLVSAILSARCTDMVVNYVTDFLFEKYKSLEDFANAELSELEEMIYSCGTYKNKAKYIRAMARQILDMGGIPTDIEELVKLRGVGRKIANLYAMSVLGQNAVVVDTHVERTCNRLGIGVGDAGTVEWYIRNYVDESKWNSLTRQLIKFGREICDAKNPKCNCCFLYKFCEFRGSY